MMKLSALEIHQKEFSHSMRGYREEEVDDFLDVVAGEVDRLRKENEELIGRIRFTESKLEGLDAERSAITETLLNAQRNADELVRAADEKAVATKRLAEEEAQEILASAEAAKREILHSLKRLKGEEERFRKSYVRLLEESIASVHEIKLPESIVAELEPKESSFAAAVARAEAEEFVESDPGVVEVPVVPFGSETNSSVEYVEVPEVEVIPVAEAEAPSVVEAPAASAFASESSSAPVSAEPEPVQGGNVSGLIMGERESEGPLDLSLDEPREFDIPGGYRWGEREDDLLIEEID